jgi:hypothetical protein
MTTEQYLRALKRLGLTTASKATAAILGLSIRQLIRISNGDSPVPEPVAKLLAMLQRHGIPKDWLPD